MKKREKWNGLLTRDRTRVQTRLSWNQQHAWSASKSTAGFAQVNSALPCLAHPRKLVASDEYNRTKWSKACNRWPQQLQKLKDWQIKEAEHSPIMSHLWQVSWHSCLDHFWIQNSCGNELSSVHIFLRPYKVCNFATIFKHRSIPNVDR